MNVDWPDLPAPLRVDGQPALPTESKPTLHEFVAEWVPIFQARLAKRHGQAVVQRALSRLRPLPTWLAKGSEEPAWLQHFLLDPQVDQAVQREWLEQEFLTEDPEWLQRLVLAERAQIARIFLLSGNIVDYAFDPRFGYRPLTAVLLDNLRREKDLVFTISLSRGLEVVGEDCPRGLPDGIQALLDQSGFRLDQALPPQLCALFDHLRRWLETEEALPRGVAVVVTNVSLLIPPDLGDLERNFLVDTLLSWSVSPALLRSRNCLVLLAEFLEDVAEELRSRGGKIEGVAVPRPSTPGSRLKFLLPLLSPQARMLDTRACYRPSGIQLEGYPGSLVDRIRSLARDTAGLTLLGIEDVTQQVTTQPLRRSEVTRTKQERLQRESGGLLEVLTPNRNLADLAGYEPLKQRIRQLAQALRADDPLVRSTLPMGVLFLGPPGTGKTLAAEALAAESGISLARLGDFRGMYVGQSERNLTRILSLIESLHPVIMFLDELDQSEGTRGDTGDSGVSRRIFGRLLAFMSDPEMRGKVLWVGASNRPDLIDSAMKRAGRFDLILPFLLPDLASRASILELSLRSRLEAAIAYELALTNEDYADLAGSMAGFSGAEIEALAGEVVRRAALEQSRPPLRVGREQVDRVRSVYLPPRGRQHYQRMEDLALAEVTCLDVLPAEFHDRCLRVRGLEA